MTTKMICAGYGGQGALVAGTVMAHAAMELGKQVLWLSSYGGEMRGGSANCSLTISEEEIANPYVNQMDILLAMNQVSLEKFEDKVKPGGFAVVNSSLVKEAHTYRSDINIIEIDATNIAMDMNNQRGANMVMIGALAQWTDLFEAYYLCKAIDHYFEGKGKLNPQNSRCFWAGAQRSTIVKRG